jgi:hypothetical protein
VDVNFYIYSKLNCNCMKNKVFKGASFVLFSMMISAQVFAQGANKKPASPAEVAKGVVNGATVAINYSSPSVKGRKIWGELVPYNAVWRAGANEATTFETSKALTIQGKTLKAGKYSLYATPGESEWRIIFNSEVGQWGTKRTGETTDDASKDVLTATVKPKKSAKFNERLVYVITKSGFELQWENLTVPVTFK